MKILLKSVYFFNQPYYNVKLSKIITNCDRILLLEKMIDTLVSKFLKTVRFQWVTGNFL